ncbi:MAG: hypothetical protein Q7S32_02155 [bacterium]|nr:hypothetical protein [bacterium]
MDIIRGQRPFALFWEWVDGAWRHQALPEDLIAEQYLVQVLERFLREDQSDILYEPLLRKLYIYSLNQRAEDSSEVRLIGDAALFIAGIMSGRLRRSAVGIDHYIKVGEAAYQMLWTREAERDAPVFPVYRRFSDDLRPFVRVLAEISREHIFKAQLEDILIVWSRYMATHDDRDRQWLLSRGVALLEGMPRTNLIS